MNYLLSTFLSKGTAAAATLCHECCMESGGQDKHFCYLDIFLKNCQISFWNWVQSLVLVINLRNKQTPNKPTKKQKKKTKLLLVFITGMVFNKSAVKTSMLQFRESAWTECNRLNFCYCLVVSKKLILSLFVIKSFGGYFSTVLLCWCSKKHVFLKQSVLSGS